MIMATNYGDDFFYKCDKGNLFHSGNKKDLFPVINQHIALKNRSKTAKVLMFKEHSSN